MKGVVISKFSGDTTGAARCPGPTNPGAAGGTLTTRLIPRSCDMSFSFRNQFPALKTLAERSALSPVMHLAARPRAFHILRRSLCLRRSPCGEDALEAFAVLQENKNPQHARDECGRDGAR